MQNKENKSLTTQTEIIRTFLKLGATSFGGPAAHVALMEEELVNNKKWLSREKFLDLYGATNLIPGPNSTELAIHISYERGGILGLFAGGISFILPAMLMVLSLAILYKEFGSIPQISNILFGIKPVIIAIITMALYRLSGTLLNNKIKTFLFILIVILSFVGIGEITLLLFSGSFMYFSKKRANLFSLNLYFPFLLTSLLDERKMELPKLFFTFLKIGSVLYGSGYVLLSFLETEFVNKLQLITKSELLDAVAIGQFTPGPVFTTATFIGYLISGIPGAILATIGIFLPAFLLVWWVNPIVPKLRSSKTFSSILDGVNVASLGFMANVSINLAKDSIVSFSTVLIFLISFLVLNKTKLNSAWLILTGGIIGIFLQ